MLLMYSYKSPCILLYLKKAWSRSCSPSCSAASILHSLIAISMKARSLLPPTVVPCFAPSATP
eukprot:c52197_g1_i1 orf=95-283(+)